jgi:hypothetical protein
MHGHLFRFLKGGAATALNRGQNPAPVSLTSALYRAPGKTTKPFFGPPREFHSRSFSFFAGNGIDFGQRAR